MAANQNKIASKPQRLNLQKISLKEFEKQNPVIRRIDYYQDQLEELFLIRHPQYRFQKNHKKPLRAFIESHLQGKPLDKAGEWFYFPWSQLLIHYLPHQLHQELRTARNRCLITQKEQAILYDTKIGITGLSIGSHAALTLAMMGVSRQMKLADPDQISGSNLNRVRYDFSHLGQNKANLAAQIIYQINPYSQLEIYPKGITKQNIEKFLNQPKIDILVEELDNLEMKIRLRLMAKKLRIPVVMATDNGDNIIIDIERYDLNPDLELFNGALGEVTIEEFQKMSPADLPKLAAKIAGPKLAVPKMQESLLQVGKTLYAWPQLGSAATLSGVAVAYVVKRIALGQKIRTGKLEVNLDAIFDPDYHSPKSKRKRENHTQKFLQAIGLN